ncbi:MAG: hypothetical protein ACERLG_11255 [Sedimentibacter sp.]
MKKRKFEILTVIIIVLFIGYLYFAVGKAKVGNEEERYNILSDAIVRSAVQCYAIEGFYPPNIQYLESNYGLVVDHDKYVISYNVFASNIIPDIDVFKK